MPQAIIRIALFNPALKDHTGTPSDNLGDLIIQEAVLRELHTIWPNAQVTSIATHSFPTSAQLTQAAHADLVIAGGSNLIGTYSRRYKNWKIHPHQLWALRGKVVLLGVGWGWQEQRPGLMAALMLKLILHQRHWHSVRDGYTQRQLAGLGIHNVLNTLCPTMWPLANISADDIPTRKSADALLMLTDWIPNPQADAALLTQVLQRYNHVYVWFQGLRDEAYFNGLATQLDATTQSRIRPIAHNMAAFEAFLATSMPFDYIGTRLHGGIKCLLNRRRSLILAVDHRAVEMAQDSHLPVVARIDLDAIVDWIEHPTPTHLILPSAEIGRWQTQWQTP